MPEQLPLAIRVSHRSDTIVINAKCRLLIEGDQRAITVAGMPFHHFAASDAVAEAYAMVHLADTGLATQEEIARVFGCTERTVRRNQRRYASGGMAALAVRSGWRAGRRRIATQRMRVIERAKASGLSNREIAHRLGLTEKAIRKQLSHGANEAAFSQPLLPIAESVAPAAAVAPGSDVATASKAAMPAEPAASKAGQASQDLAARKRAEPNVVSTLDGDPDDRTTDRLLACLGHLSDATPLFGRRTAVSGGGVLFAVPALVVSGLFGVAGSLYGEIGPAFYGLRTSLMTLLFMALWRIKRSESLKEHPPAMLGNVLGLDRVPEVKTLRRKLTRLAQLGHAKLLGRALARLRVEQRGRLMGFLYIDGHVRAYHGKHTIPKTHVARMRLSMPATTDYWVNDRSGDPLFVVTAEANAALTKMMPTILAEMRKTVGQRRVTIVFDRGGWSPKLFRQLLAQRFDILTYRKGRARLIDEKRFVLRQARLDGRSVKYRLHDQPVRFLKGRLRLRQVTRLSDDGCHQTQVITSRWDLKDIEIAYRMFERWRQENFFKYMREEFLLDALCDYKTDPDDPKRSVPNPKRHALDKEVSAARIELAKLEQEFGAAAMDNPESRRPTMRGFKITHGKVGKSLRAARARLAGLKAKRRLVPTRVEVGDVTEGNVVKLASERKHLTNILKMVAYQAESDLLAVLRPHYARADEEGRTLLQELLRAPADINATSNELQVTLCPLSSPHRTSAIHALCASLNETETLFPGTKLRIRYDVHAPLVRGMAFPGPRPTRAATPLSRSPKPDSSREG
jgi:transposase